MKTHTAAMVLVGAVAGLRRLGGGSGRCLGPPWSAGFERHAPSFERHATSFERHATANLI